MKNIMQPCVTSPQSETELMERARGLCGITLGQLAAQLPARRYHKGWAGQLLEGALGATAASLPLPDFRDIAVELKTLPLGTHGFPRESTFVTSIALLDISQETWQNSTVFTKLRRVLWVPIEGDPKIPVMQRRIGKAFLWGPSVEQEAAICNDWHDLVEMIATGQLEMITARHGKVLQVRPKAADGKSLCWGIDAQGKKVLTLPRGFYLRASFTCQLLAAASGP